MAKLPPKRKHILRNVLLCIAAVPVLIVLAILVIIFVITPILEGVDKAKFLKMDSNSRIIFNQLQAASKGEETWTYEASCTDGGSGGFQTVPIFNCSTKSSTEVKAISAAQIIALHEKYFPVVDGSVGLKPTTALDKQYPSQFGTLFVVSSAERQYTLKDGGEKCDYIAELAQPYNIEKSYNHTYGSPIQSGGRIVISFTCTAIAQGNWYE